MAVGEQPCDGGELVTFDPDAVELDVSSFPHDEPPVTFLALVGRGRRSPRRVRQRRRAQRRRPRLRPGDRRAPATGDLPGRRRPGRRRAGHGGPCRAPAARAGPGRGAAARRLAFTLYNYAIYTLAIHVGPLFLLWTVVLGLAAYALI